MNNFKKSAFGYIKRNLASNTGFSLNEYQAKQFLSAYGIPVVEEHLAASPEDAVQSAEKLGFPVVLKALVPGVHHKSDSGLVKLNLNDARQLLQAANDLSKSTSNMDLLVQKQVSGNRELMLGMFRDPHFGPVVLIGLGGIFTEVLDDVSLSLAPVTRDDISEMIAGLRGSGILGAFRGQKPIDFDSLERIITAICKIIDDFPQLAELDINPLIIDSAGKLTAVDALLGFNPEQIEKHLPCKPVPSHIIHGFFHPRSLAFIGASAQLGKWGHMLTVNTIGGGFRGKVYLVNSKGGKIAGRKVYRSVEEIESSVDLAVVTIPAGNVLQLLEQFKRKGINKVLLISSGFGESGPAGREMERKLVAAAEKAGIYILGPNTMGICNPHIGLFCTGTAVRPSAGSTAVIAQSGNMGTQLLAFAEQQAIGIRAFAGSGNEAMICMEDYLESLEKDVKTRTIMVYLENVTNGRRFFKIAQRLSSRKPIVLLKGGQTSAGNRAAASHTGALASNQRVFEAMCRQAGIIKVEYPMDLLDLSAAFSSLPMPRGKRVAIMTLGGGWGVVTADLCEKYGLEIPQLDRTVIAGIDDILPPYWSKSNPVDLVGEPDTSIPKKILAILLNWSGCDAVIDLGILGRSLFISRLADSIRKADPETSETTLEQVLKMFRDFEDEYINYTIKLMENTGKPVFGVSLLADAEKKTVYHKSASSFKAVYYETPERAVKAMANMFKYYQYITRNKQHSLQK